ncbi:DUF3293 domain-containing protein [Inquilinus sp. Marseille-Q2685]|uniref:DUF3293 domain-containing protein n=1 Tax=Inquilinus sp. Marseille-Q2685 TaxID=2866581 RepID=UPI001CE450DB|nr:DUF3293 domain-containing protein [Inquilinus sp. Marseille-Q2685]
MGLSEFIRLLEAYRDTRYLFAADGVEHEVRIDRRNPAAEAWLAGRGAAGAGFVTADNPRSLLASPAENAAARQRLAEAVRRRGADSVPHTGAGLDGAWPPEQGLLVLGLPVAELTALAEEFGQNAIVWFAPGQPARLVPTRLLLEGLRPDAGAD